MGVVDDLDWDSDESSAAGKPEGAPKWGRGGSKAERRGMDLEANEFANSFMDFVNKMENVEVPKEVVVGGEGPADEELGVDGKVTAILKSVIPQIATTGSEIG